MRVRAPPANTLRGRSLGSKIAFSRRTDAISSAPITARPTSPRPASASGGRVSARLFNVSRSRSGGKRFTQCVRKSWTTAEPREARMADCLFCGIIAGKIKGDIVYRDDRIVAFRDVRPQAPVQIGRAHV